VGSGGVGEFTYCGVRFILAFGESGEVELMRSGKWCAPQSGLALDRLTSRSIFRRTGEIEAVRFTLPT
jgi:hypothetical protein